MPLLLSNDHSPIILKDNKSALVETSHHNKSDSENVEKTPKEVDSLIVLNEDKWFVNIDKYNIKIGFDFYSVLGCICECGVSANVLLNTSIDLIRRNKCSSEKEFIWLQLVMKDLMEIAEKKALIDYTISEVLESCSQYSRDGLSCSSGYFASATQVNNKGPTVLIIKATTGAIFGGYTSLNWNFNRVYNVDPYAFLFSVQSNTGEERFKKIGSVSSSPSNSIYQASPVALMFGGGNDLMIGCSGGLMIGTTNPMTYVNMGQYYLTGSGIPYSSAGSSFNVTDFEMYTL